MKLRKIQVISAILLSLTVAPAFAGQLCTESGGASIAETKTVDSGSADTQTLPTQSTTTTAGVPDSPSHGHMHGGGNWTGHGNWGGNPSDPSSGP